MNACKSAILLLCCTGFVSAQVSIINSVDLGVGLVGIGAASGKLTVASADTNYELNPTTLAVIGSQANSGNVVDIGKLANGLATIELHADGTFAAYSDADRSIIYSGNIGASASAAWGISDSFLVGGNEYVQIGFVPLANSSSRSIGIFNLTTGNLDPGFNSVLGLPPTGLSTYLSTDYPSSDTYYYRQIAAISGSSPLVYDYGTYYYGSGVGTFLSGSSASELSDVTTMGGNIFITSSNGFVEYGAYPLLSSTGLTAVPEPATYAIIVGMIVLGTAIQRRRHALRRAVSLA